MKREFESLTETQRKAYFEYIVAKYEQKIPVVTMSVGKNSKASVPEM